MIPFEILNIEFTTKKKTSILIYSVQCGTFHQVGPFIANTNIYAKTIEEEKKGPEKTFINNTQEKPNHHKIIYGRGAKETSW